MIDLSRDNELTRQSVQPFVVLIGATGNAPEMEL